MDISWISSQAKEIHAFFVSIFYLLATLLLLVGVLVDYFKMPLGGTPGFAQLVGRALIAGILLTAYPQISNSIAGIADAVADHLGGIDGYKNALHSAGAALKQHSYSWTSIGDTLLSVVAYAAYLILYLSVYFFDAAIVYSLTLLYIFSPILIAFYILPGTASMTSGLFRTLFEIAAWKIIFAVLGILLWSTALNNFSQSGQGNFITLIALTLMLAFSLLLTPIVVRNLISGTVSNIAAQTAGFAAIGLSAGFLSPASLASLTAKGTKTAGKSTLKTAGKAMKHGYKMTNSAFSSERFSKKIPAIPNNVIPFPNSKKED